MVTKMKLTTEEPTWTLMCYAPRQINKDWDKDILIKYIIDNNYATKNQILNQEDVHNVLRRRSNREMTDWYPDIWAVSDNFIAHVKDDLRRNEADLFYNEQYLEYEKERLKEEEEKKKQEPE